MVRKIKDRKEFFSLLQSVSESNRNYYSKYGNWNFPQIKVFWIEVNEPFFQNVINSINPKLLSKDFYECVFDEDFYWIDTSEKRIWQIFTFAKTNNANRTIRNNFTNLKGVDRIWLTETFMKKIQKEMNYTNRGFGIHFKDILSIEEPKSDFSAKLWIGKSYTASQEKLLKVANETFAVSSIRFGINPSQDSSSLSGKLYELYFRGHMTVTTCDDLEDLFTLLKFIRTTYKNEIGMLEKECSKKPNFIEIQFSESINSDGFELMTKLGQGDMKLWLQSYKKESDISRYCGVDLHTGDFIQIDLADDYSYLAAEKNACMNVAPRFGTVASRYLTSNSKIIFDGVEMFA